MIITLDTFKDLSGISGSDYDDFLSFQLEVVSEAIESYCRRKFSTSTYVQTFYKDDLRDSVEKYIQLFCYPLVTLNSISLDGSVFSTSGSSVRVDKETSTLVDPKKELVFCDKMEISYSAGLSQVPNIIKSVIVSIVSDSYNKKKSGISMSFGSDVQRVSIPGTLSIDFDYSLSSNERSSAFGTILGVHLNSLDHFRSERRILGRGKITYVS